MFEVGDLVVYKGNWDRELAGQVCKVTEVSTEKGIPHCYAELVTPFPRGNGFTIGLGAPSSSFEPYFSEIAWEV